MMQLSYLTSLLWLGIVQQQGCYGLASYSSTVAMALHHTAARFLWSFGFASYSSVVSIALRHSEAWLLRSHSGNRFCAILSIMLKIVLTEHRYG